MGVSTTDYTCQTLVTNITYIVVDGTEIGSHNRIPLWMFGMMY